MKNDEFAFFNQQLATMLRSGMQLEGALRQLSASMQRGGLRTELELLEADLRQGKPLEAALARRQLPEFYQRMVRIGVAGNDLPAMLLLLADYYHQVDSLWTRLKGVMVYPLMVLTVSFALSCFLTLAFTRLLDSNFQFELGVSSPQVIRVLIMTPPVVIGLLLLAALAAVFVPAINRSLRWRVPAFKEAKLAQVASAMELMLKSGGNLADALGLIQQMEAHTLASPELAQWQSRLAAGRGKFSEMAEPGRAFPPMFLWLVSNAGEDLAAGFGRAAEMYGARARYKVDMFLYAVLPFSIVVLGGMSISQVLPVVQTLVNWMNMITNVGS